MKKHICEDCGREILSLGLASHKAMHVRDNKMLERFNNKKEIDYLKTLMKGDSKIGVKWCRKDIKDAYGINDRVLNIILSR